MKWKLYTGYLGPDQDIYHWGKDMVGTAMVAGHFTEDEVAAPGLVALLDAGGLSPEQSAMAAYRETRLEDFELYMSEINAASVWPGPMYLPGWIHSTAERRDGFAAWTAAHGGRASSENPGEFRRRIVREFALWLRGQLREDVVFVHGPRNRGLMIWFSPEDTPIALTEE